MMTDNNQGELPERVAEQVRHLTASLQNQKHCLVANLRLLGPYSAWWEKRHAKRQRDEMAKDVRAWRQLAKRFVATRAIRRELRAPHRCLLCGDGTFRQLVGVVDMIDYKNA